MRAAGRDAAPSGRRREEGIALFVVVVVVTILYILVWQLCYVSKIEERIAGNRQGYVSMSYALGSTARWVMAQIQDDLEQDAEEAGSGASVPLTGAGGAGGRAAAGGAAATPAKGPGGTLRPMGTAGLPGGGGLTVDALGEPLFVPSVQSLNEVDVKVIVGDGEGRIDLNRLFDYAALLRAKRVSDRDGGPQVRGMREEAPEAQAPAEAEEEAQPNRFPSNWEPPTQEKIDATIDMLERLVQAVIEWNEANGYYYHGMYNPSIVARQIADYVMERKSMEGDAHIFQVTELLNLEEVTPELYMGPRPAFLDDPEAALEAGLVVDGFGDIHYDPDAWGLQTEESLQDTIQQEFGMYGTGAYGTQAGGLADYSGYLSQMNWMTEFPENEEGTGILRPPVPIGLRDVFTTFSSGKINLNTVHPTVLIALLRAVAMEDAWEVVEAIDQWRNSYREEEGEEEGDAAKAEALAKARTDEEVLSALEGQGGVEDLFGANLELNTFSANWKMEIQQVGDGELLKPSAARAIDASKEQNLYQQVVNSLEPVATCRSEYFLVELKAKKDNVFRVGELVVRRDYASKWTRVILWRDRLR